MPQSQINVVVNNILLHHFDQIGRGTKDHKMKLLLAIAEYIHNESKAVSTRRLGRIMFYSGLLYAKIEVLQQAPFLMGSIFTLGGLLKIEVRNYLQTKSKYDPEFRVVCPLIEEGKAQEESMQRFKRDLTKTDIEFFEQEDGFLRVVTFFIQTVTKGKEGAITGNDFNYYMDFSQLEYGEIFDEEKRSNPQLVGRLEASHYMLSWLFDLLQYCFQYLVKADKTGQTANKE